MRVIAANTDTPNPRGPPITPRVTTGPVLDNHSVPSQLDLINTAGHMMVIATTKVLHVIPKPLDTRMKPP